MLLVNILRHLPFPKKYTLLHRLCPRSGQVDDVVFGYRTHLNLENYIERGIYLRVYEQAEAELLSKLLCPGDTFVDVGANVGFYSLLASQRVGDAGRVMAFEPAPYALAKLRRVVADNSITNIVVEGAGLGDAEGALTLYLPDTLQNYTPSMVRGPGDKSVTVPVYTLDGYLDIHGVERVDLMKLDVEGFEPNVIQGGRKSFATGTVRRLFVEFNATWLGLNGSSAQLLYDLLHSLGFTTTHFDPSANFQNLLFTHCLAG